MPGSSSGCVGPADQRPGSQTTLVPVGASAVQLCVIHADDSQTDSAAAPDVAELAATMNALPIALAQTVCHGPAATRYLVRFDYPTGAAVLITVNPMCTPGVGNGYQRAAATPALIAELSALTGVK